MPAPDSSDPPAGAASCPRCGAPHAAGAPCQGASTLAFGAPTPPPLAPGPGPDPLVGAQVGSFRIVRLLGRGGMGTVYLAEHPAIGSRVAVKFLHESMSQDPAAVGRFYDEARAANLIGHENIVGIYDLAVLPPGRHYFVMEHLEGDTLLDLVRQGPVPPEVAKDVLLQLCDALQCAHDRGVVHRDLKPDNVFLVRRRGKAHFVKLVDFGIAKLRGAQRAGQTAAGMVIGTPEYMAPEQCEDGAIDARTDVYALGVMAFELVTGRLPFVGKSVTQLLLAHLREAPPAPSSLAPVEPALERAIQRAMEKDPAKRFQTMEELGAAIEAARFGPTATSTATSSATPPAAEPPQALSALRAELGVPGASPRALAVVELTRAGAFLRAEGDLPPLLSRVKVALSHPSLKAPLALDAEVVRHVGAADAQAWRMTPGLALQFKDPPPEARAALARIADETRRDAPAPAPAAARPDPAAADARLRDLEARRDGHYALLGLAPDAEFSDVRRAAKALREELEALRARPLAAEHPRRATALLAQVTAALEALGSPAARLAHDARRGNFRGVERCLQAGLSETLVEERRRAFLAAEPARGAEAQRQLARARVAARLGNPKAAEEALTAALAADPLDRAAREAWAAFRAGRPL